MGISAKDCTVNNYFKSETALKIPRYQRDYSWDKNNVDTLMKDIYLNDEGYYIGNVMTSSINTELFKNVIDGQQRIISITLIMIALHCEFEQDFSDLIIYENKVKILIEDRIDSQGRSLLDSLYRSEELTELQQTYNEVTIYKHICKEIHKNSIKEDGYKEKLSDRVKKSMIIEVHFPDESISHDMFINLNVKGKKLTNIDIVKSQLFKYLLAGSSNDYYKEQWHIMKQQIGENSLEDYLRSVATLLSSSLTRKKEVIDVYFENINSKDSAEKVFSLLSVSTEPSNLIKVYKAVKEHNLNSLQSYLNVNGNYSLDAIDSIWKIIEETKFVQFDIVLIALFFQNGEYRRVQRIQSNFEVIVRFVKLILMFQVYNSSKKVSPSQYASYFIESATKLYSDSRLNIVDEMKNIVKKQKISSLDYEEVKTTFRGLDCTGKGRSQDLRIAKHIVQIIDENMTNSLIGDHILAKSKYDIKYAHQAGNILPVVQDLYDDLDIELKNDRYLQNSGSNISIKNYLSNPFNEENYKDMVTMRTEMLADKFTSMFNELLSEFTSE